MRRIVGVALAAVLLGGCGESSSSSEPADAVPWDDYAPGLQKQIDALGTSKDCAGLQQQFDTAESNNAAVQAKTGHNNAELMNYVNATMEKAGC